MVSAIWYLLLLPAKGVVIGRLVLDGLVRKYPFFTAFMVLNVARSVALAMIGGPAASQTPVYRQIWLVTTPLLVLSQGAAVTEVIVGMCRLFRGFSRIAPLVFSVFAILSGIVCWLTVQWAPVNWKSPVAIMLMIDRYTGSFLALFVLCTLAFFSQPGLRMKRNLRRHSALFAWVLGMDIVILTLYQLHLAPPSWMRLLNLASWMTFCILWTTMIRRSGEQEVPKVHTSATLDELETGQNILQPVARFRHLLESGGIVPGEGESR